jgi:hypothetical protein
MTAWGLKAYKDESGFKIFCRKLPYSPVCISARIPALKHAARITGARKDKVELPSRAILIVALGCHSFERIIFWSSLSHLI